MPGVGVIPLAGSTSWCGWSESLRLGLITPEIRLRLVRRVGEIDRGAQQFQHQFSTVTDPLRVGLDLHPRLDLARTGRNECPEPRHLDDTNATGIHRRQRIAVAEDGCVDCQFAAGIEDRRSFGNADLLSIDRQRDHSRQACPSNWCQWNRRRHDTFPFWKRWSLAIADWTAFAAVWPRPQIDASRITRPTSSIKRSSPSTDSSGLTARQSPQGFFLTHRPDAARHALSARLVAEERSDPQEDIGHVGRVIEDHDDP